MPRRFLLTLLISLVCAAAERRHTVFIGRMGGFEAQVKKAFSEKEIDLEIIEEDAHPDLRVLLGKSFTSVWAEIQYRKQTGRREESELQAIDVKTGKEIASHRFHMGDEVSRRRAASAFADLLKRKLPR
ncbi:MAG: hypothetical protein ACKV22_05230 [Bryobacteraceae bacterium]